MNGPGAAAARLAVYFVPADGTALARFGNGVLGRDARGRPCAPDPALPPTPAAWVAAPARYGFHATLKAPFHLADGVEEGDLRAACERLAATLAPVPLPTLAPRRLGSFTALALPDARADARADDRADDRADARADDGSGDGSGDESGDGAGDGAEARTRARVDALAAACVSELDGLRAPLDAETLARRRPETLEPAARARLERWGYPHVFEGFRFHMTLSGSLEETPGLAAWRAALGRAYRELVGDGAVLDRLALCRESAPGGAFTRVAELPLGRAA